MEDKIITTNGYSLVLTDEGCGLFEDLKWKDVKHEGDLSMLNQLFDRKGDFAQNKECAVPKKINVHDHQCPTRSLHQWIKQFR